MTTQGKEFVFSRTFDAPRELAWKAWTEAEHVKKWFGPKGATVTSCKIDLKPGGLNHYALKTVDGTEIWGKFIYREINPPERIVGVQSFSDAKGGVTRHPLSTTWPLEMLSVTTFKEEKGKTTVTINWSPIDPTPEERSTFDNSIEGMKVGWTGTFDNLAAYVAKAKS